MPLLESISSSLYDLSQYIFNPGQRIYWPYLLGALVLITPVFLSQKCPKTLTNFFKFVFPKRIWLSSSAKQDYLILIINKLIRGALLAPILIAMVPIALSITEILEWLFGSITPVTESNLIIVASFTLLLFVIDDLSRFVLHWLLHHIPFLWEIHKVHHSAKVLTPFTVYRSHPIENYLFASRLAVAQGLAIGISYFLFGPTLSVAEFAGANIFVFVFNMLGSNLRHSHIWLSWGSPIERWFISPAQHQVHHSDNPIHFDKNLGSALAVWDRIAGSLILAKEVNRINFGIGRGFSDHDKLSSIYWLPIKSSWQTAYSGLSRVFNHNYQTKK